MNGNRKTSVNRDARLETFAAELALAAYRVALRTRTDQTWLDLELALWKALAEALKTRGSVHVPLTAGSDAAGRANQRP
jgi:hypothetical protein